MKRDTTKPEDERERKRLSRLIRNAVEELKANRAAAWPVKRAGWWTFFGASLAAGVVLIAGRAVVLHLRPELRAVL